MNKTVYHLHKFQSRNVMTISVCIFITASLLNFNSEPQDIDPPLQPIEESVPEHSGSMSADFTCQTSVGLSSNTPRKKETKKVN